MGNFISGGITTNAWGRNARDMGKKWLLLVIKQLNVKSLAGYLAGDGDGAEITSLGENLGDSFLDLGMRKRDTTLVGEVAVSDLS